KVHYLTQPIGDLVLSSHPDFPLLKSCKDELAVTPRQSKSSASMHNTFSDGQPSPQSGSRLLMVLDTDPTLASMRAESSTMARDRAISSTRLHRSTITNNTTWSSSLSNLSQPGQSTGSHATINSTKLDTSIPVTIRMYTKVKGHVSCSYCTLTSSINTRIMYPQSKYARMLMRGFSSCLIASPSSFARVGWISVVCRSRFFSKGAGMLLVLTRRSL